MDLSAWGIPNTVQGWGITPISLVAPAALVVMMVMVRCVARAAGPKTDRPDFGSAALIFVIIGAAFLWIFAGLGLMARMFQ